jgi:hypothetical protein
MRAKDFKGNEDLKLIDLRKPEVSDGRLLAG